MSCENPTNNEKPEEKRYEPPKIIFEDVISTRAGSPIVGGDLNPPVQDNEIELFPTE